MKSMSKFMAGTAAGFFALCSAVLAAPCGVAPAPACDVPEPSSLWLVAVGIAGVVFVARKLK